MATEKKPAQKKSPAKEPKLRASTAKTKRPTIGSKVVLPAIETTALEQSLEPRDPKKKTKPKKKQASPKQPLVLPGYFAFTIEVWRVLWKHKSTFWRLIIVYAVLSGIFVGLASQSVYSQLSDLLRESGGQVLSGDTAKIGETGELLLASLTGAGNSDVGEAQQLIGGLLIIIIWLTTVWLLRAFLAGHTPRLRDGFYNSGTPLVPTFVLSFVLILQLIPAAIAVIGIAAAVPTGLVSGVIALALFWIVAILLIVLSLYLITSTYIALVIVTLPGMYPMKALSTARTLVEGRRLRIILRMLWLLLISICFWTLIMVPIIIFDAWFKGLLSAVAWVPIVPVAFVIMSSITVVWAASYSYMLYRKVVDDGSAST